MKNRIAEFRDFRNLTQEQLGEMAGVSKQYIGLLERGDRRLNSELMEKIAAALKCRPTDLIDDIGLPEKLAKHLNLLQSMSERDQDKVLDYAQTLRRASLMKV